MRGLGGGLFDPLSNFKTSKPIKMKLLQKMNNYKSFDFIYLSLENYILLFVFYDVIKFETIENKRIFDKFIY